MQKVVENMSVPKLRFKEFGADWEMKYGNDIFKSISNKNHNSDLPILAISQEFGAIPRDMIDYKITVASNSISSYKVVEIGDFIISLRSFQGGIEYSNYKGICSPAYNILRPFVRVDNQFYKYYLKTFKYIQNLKRKLEGIREGKMISYKYFSEIKLPYPTLPEQKKIASFLSSVDEKLQQLGKKKSLLEAYKKGVMQKIFLQELRFKDANGNNYPDWQEKKLGELCEIKKGQQLNKDELILDGQYPAINGGITPSGFTNEWNTSKNTITISEGGNSCGYVNYITTDFWCGGHCYSISKVINLDKIFLFQFLKFKQDYIMRLRKGSGLPNINKSEIILFKVSVPSLAEQNKIANFLSAIDAKIDLVNTQIENTEAFKKGLLQQMFV